MNNINNTYKYYNINQLRINNNISNNNSSINSKALNNKSSIKITNRNKQIRMRLSVIGLLIICITLFSMNSYKTKATTIPGNDTNQITYESVHINNGDSMWDIANAHTDGSKKQIKYCMKEIRRINHMSRFELIKAGNSIIVPNLN